LFSVVANTKGIQLQKALYEKPYTRERETLNKSRKIIMEQLKMQLANIIKKQAAVM
jgi:hypothetical protein